MRRALILLTLTVLILLAPLAQAQPPDEESIPLYVRYCNFTREQTGDETLIAAVEEAGRQFETISTFLQEVENGRRTFLEAIAAGEEAVAAWDAAQKLDCLAPLNADVTRALQEIVIAMLYGQLTDTDNSATHLQTARTMMDNIARQSTEAISYLTTTPLVEPTPTLDPNAPPTPEEGAVRSSEELSAELTSFLQNNGVTVLIEAGVQSFPGNTLIVVQLDRYVANGRDYDYDNTLFTFEVISRAIQDWPELEDISRIAIETYDGGNRTLYAETSGENFRSHYYVQTLSDEEFVNQLIIQLPE